MCSSRAYSSEVAAVPGSHADWPTVKVDEQLGSEVNLRFTVDEPRCSMA